MVQKKTREKLIFKRNPITNQALLSNSMGRFLNESTHDKIIERMEKKCLGLELKG